MAESALSTMSFLVLNYAMRSDYRAAVVKHAIDQRDQVAATKRRRLEAAIRKRVRIKGFRDPLRASPNQLVREVAQLSYRIDTLLGAILDVWVDSHADLKMAVQGFLTAREVPVVEFTDLQTEFVGIWTVNEMQGVTVDFREEYPDFDEDDTALMLCCMTGRAPLPEEATMELCPEGKEPSERDERDVFHKEASALKWKLWLEELGALPADAPEWGVADEFIESVRQLAEAKRQEIETTRGRLKRALDALISQTASFLDYFDLTDVTMWVADACPLAEAAGLANQVDQLRESLEKHEKLRQRPTPTLAEDRVRRIELERLEEQIAQAYSCLASVLVPASSPGKPPTEPSGGRPIPEEIPPETEESTEVVPFTAPTAPSIPSDEVPAVSKMAETQASVPMEQPPVAEVVGQSPVPSAEDILSILPQEEATESVDEPAEPEVPFSATGKVIELLPAVAEEIAETLELLVETVFGEVTTPFREMEAVAAAKEATEPTEAFVKSKPIPAPHPGLRSSREVAALLQSDDCDENWHSLVWALVAEDDLPGACWLTRSLLASRRMVPVPDVLLAAAQGSRWISVDSERFAVDLLEIVQDYQFAPDDAQELIVLAVALRPALVSPYSGLIDWLRVPSCCPELDGLVTAVKSFASLGIALHPADLLGVTGAKRREANLAEAARAAKVWLDQAPARRMKLKRASDVWYHLVNPIGELRALVLPVSEDRRLQVDQVRQNLHQWQQPDFASERIDQIDRKLAKAKSRQIIGPARQQLIRHMEEACSVVSNWCTLVEHEREIESRGTWLFEQVGALRTEAQRTLPKAWDVLGRLSDLAQSESQVAAISCLRRAFKQLLNTLDLSHEVIEIDSVSVNSWECLLPGAQDLQQALASRLMWLPDIPLGSGKEPDEKTLPMIAMALRDSCVEARTLGTAFEGWLQKQDYRFIEWLLSALRDETDATELSRHYQEMLNGSKAALRASIDETSNAIEQALVDGIIADERSEYVVKVEGINPAETLSFEPKHQELQKVRESLSVARQRRLEELSADWQSLRERLASSPVEVEKQQQVHSFVQSALEQEDTRVVEESLARLRSVIDTGSELDESWFRPIITRDVLAEFLDSMSRIETWLSEGRLSSLITAAEQGRTQAGLRFGELPKTRRDEVARGLSAWRFLKQQPSMPEDDLCHHVATLLNYLGFELERGRGAPIEVKRPTGPGWLYMRALMSASDLARPIPQFGSQAHGQYHLVCLWERPGADTIAARLRKLQLSAHSVLVLYLGRLTAKQRRDLTIVSRERELALAVLDETLLVFLAGEHDARLRTFLACALPFTALNPYTPFQAGDVPPEMFFGREEMARELQRLSGSCLVYGGRQLGKSALLRHVERQFRYPQREQYAWVGNLKLIFDPQAGKRTENIWRALREDFKRENLLPAQIRTNRAEDIYRYIREMMLKFPERRVLVMYDEADDFLDADSADSFRQVTALRELMLETQRRFKVVFAGLHNVQRFQGIPNQPLAHFGTPLCVGPLEPNAAQQLVLQPMEVLGYRFADNSAILRILSYTNYHPGLIQLFCQELLKRSHKSSVSAIPPYNIEHTDVEAIYRDPSVRERIRERFDWTLALDTRYQAIAWMLIEDQMEIQDSYAQAYPPGDILKLVRFWWPQGFGDVGIGELRGPLDEMCGLGVLVRNSDGHYRLRSPNLVRLMGTEGDIRDRLAELTEKQPPRPPDANNHHAPLDEAARRYSPLTYAQDRNLNPPRSGVGLVFASEASGLPMLPDALARFVPRGLADDIGGSFEIPTTVTDGEDLRKSLETYSQIYSRYERLIIYHRLTLSDPAILASLVKEALDFCHRTRLDRQRLRILLIFAPPAAWAWLSLPQNLREDLEARADAVEFTQCWNTVGLRQRLAQHGKMDTDAICQQILQATGGWHSLLQTLFDRSGQQDDPRAFVQEMESELADSGSRLRQDFCHSLGLEVSGVIPYVLDFVYQEQKDGVPADFVTPEFIKCEPALTPEECSCAIEYLKQMNCVVLRSGTLFVEDTVGRVMPLR